MRESRRSDDDVEEVNEVSLTVDKFVEKLCSALGKKCEAVRKLLKEFLNLSAPRGCYELEMIGMIR